MVKPEELRRWLTRRQLLESIGRLKPCQYGYGMARDRALEMRACGASRVDVWKTINHDYPALRPTTVSTILEEAFSQGLPTPEP